MKLFIVEIKSLLMGLNTLTKILLFYKYKTNNLLRKSLEDYKKEKSNYIFNTKILIHFYKLIFCISFMKKLDI